MTAAEIELIATVWLLYLANCCHVARAKTPCLLREGKGWRALAASREREWRVVVGHALPWRGWLAECAGDEAVARPSREARGRWRRFTARTSLLKQVSAAQGVFLLVFAPIAIGIFGLANIWLVLLADMVLLHLLVLGMFAWTHHAVFGAAQRAERGQAMLTLALYPIGGVRAMDVLTRHLLRDSGVFAAAQLAMEPHQRLGLARRRYFDDPPQREALRRVLGAAEYEALLCAPAQSADSRAYCPRCHEQYVIEQGECADCGIALAAFATDKSAATCGA